MKSLTVYTGRESPMRAQGINQTRLLNFAINFPTWHTAKQDKRTQKALHALVEKGYLEVNDFGQFKIKL